MKRRLSRVEAALQLANIPKKDKDMLYDFENFIVADGLGRARVAKYLQSLKRLYDLSPGSICRASRKDILALLARIELSDYTAWTKHDYKLALRKYLLFCGLDELACLIRLPKVHSYKLPEELLIPDEIQDLLSCETTSHYTSFTYNLYESGARIGELLSLQRKHIVMDHIGAVLILDGKTGMRRVRLIESAPALDEWISCRSLRPDDPVFPNTYRAYAKHLKVLAYRAGIEKRIYPHLFRHSRATFLAGYLTEAQLCAYFGWTLGSAMPRIYVHLCGADLDRALMNVPTLLNTQRATPVLRSG